MTRTSRADPDRPGLLRSPEALHLITRRAIRSARSCIETLCESEVSAAMAPRIAWNTQRLQPRIPDADLYVHDLLELHDAVRCLELLGLLRRPFPDRLHIIQFAEEIDDYELSAELGLH